jgi:general secretion pathway protein F
MMAAFDYEALDQQGARRIGVITADSARHARRELRQSKLVPLRVEAASTSRLDTSALLQRLRPPRISASELALFTRQLATLVSAAAPLEEALHTIAMQCESKPLQKTIFAVRTAVTEGARLSEAFRLYPNVFSSFYTSLVDAGESSGTLGIVLERLADNLETSGKLKGKVMAAIIYPCVLAVVAMAVVMLLLIFVVPKVVDQFASLGQDLPLITRATIGISWFVQVFALPAVVLAIGTGFLVRRQLAQPHGRLRIHRMMLNVPVMGRVVAQHQTARLARTLATLFAAGVPVLEALHAARATLSNAVLASAIERVAIAVREGSSLSAAIRQEKVFPPIVTYMAASGEGSGRLDAMLDKAADQLEREFESTTVVAVGLLEPAIIVVMGAVVGLIIMAILMPIFQLNSLALM